MRENPAQLIQLHKTKNLRVPAKPPGCTQLINFFQLQNSSDFRLVDLPGYGYAKVSQSMKEKWQQPLSQYLHERQCLKGLILLMDIRHSMQELDTMMINWAVECEMPLHTLLTKSDKLSRGAAQDTLLKFRKEMINAGVDDFVTGQTFSALNGDGVDQLAKQLRVWLQSE
jgi:GTP-binding protein